MTTGSSSSSSGSSSDGSDSESSSDNEEPSKEDPFTPSTRKPDSPPSLQVKQYDLERVHVSSMKP